MHAADNALLSYTKPGTLCCLVLQLPTWFEGCSALGDVPIRLSSNEMISWLLELVERRSPLTQEITHPNAFAHLCLLGLLNC